MFPFHRTNQSHLTARLFDVRAQLVVLALASVLLSAAAAGGSSSESKSSFTHTPSVTQATTARSEVVMTITRRDFGDVFAGEELDAAFGVRNAGTAPLELAQKSTLGKRQVKPANPAWAALHANNIDSLLTLRVAARRVAPT